MKAYKRKNTLSFLFLIAAVVLLFSSILSFLMNQNSQAVLQAVIALLFAFDFYIYRKPYLLLGEDKIIINLGIRNKEYPLSGAEIGNQNQRYIELAYNQDGSGRGVKVSLTQMNKETKERFITDLQAAVTAAR